MPHHDANLSVLSALFSNRDTPPSLTADILAVGVRIPWFERCPLHKNQDVTWWDVVMASWAKAQASGDRPNDSAAPGAVWRSVTSDVPSLTPTTPMTWPDGSSESLAEHAMARGQWEMLGHWRDLGLLPEGLMSQWSMDGTIKARALNASWLRSALPKAARGISGLWHMLAQHAAEHSWLASDSERAVFRAKPASKWTPADAAQWLERISADPHAKPWMWGVLMSPGHAPHSALWELVPKETWVRVLNKHKAAGVHAMTYAVYQYYVDNNGSGPVEPFRKMIDKMPWDELPFELLKSIVTHPPHGANAFSTTLKQCVVGHMWRHPDVPLVWADANLVSKNKRMSMGSMDNPELKSWLISIIAATGRMPWDERVAQPDMATGAVSVASCVLTILPRAEALTHVPAIQSWMRAIPWPSDKNSEGSCWDQMAHAAFHVASATHDTDPVATLSWAGLVWSCITSMDAKGQLKWLERLADRSDKLNKTGRLDVLERVDNWPKIAPFFSKWPKISPRAQAYVDKVMLLNTVAHSNTPNAPGRTRAM